MRLLILTQAVDRGDPILGFFHQWIEEFAKRCESVEVICLRGGVHHLPANVRVHVIGKGGLLLRAIRAQVLAWRLRARYDAVFVHMNPEYLLIAGPLWRFLGKRASLWYNHPAKNMRLWIAAVFADRVFYTSPYAATAHMKKAEQMPVGIDTELFSPQSTPRDRRALYMQGRIAPSKRIELALTALRILREHVPVTLTLVGPENAAYAKELRARFADLVESGAAVFLGPKGNEETPLLYSVHGATINLAASGHFDKSAFEAMACETPAVVSSEAFTGLIPAEWIVSQESAAALAAALGDLIALPEQAYRALAASERTAVVRGHGLAMLVGKLMMRL